MPRFTSLTLAVILSLNTTIIAADPYPVPVVRVLNPRLAQTLDEAVRLSPTLRTLLNELEGSDLIVHVTGRPWLESGLATRRLAGTMRFVTATPTRRFLRISVDESLGPRARAALLAHELWHALEVARAPHVVDQHTFATLYQHVGHRSPGSASWYDTRDALSAGETVFLEIGRKQVSR